MIKYAARAMDLVKEFVTYVAATLLALLPIVNPFSAVALVVGITAHLSEDERNEQLRRACIYMFAILVTFLVAGGVIINFFGISIPGLRIAGGLVVSYLGFRMLFPDVQPLPSAAQAEAMTKQDLSFTPLAMPSLSGPGSIAVVIGMSSTLRTGRGLEMVVDYVAVVVGIGLTALISWLVLRAAGKLNAVLGANGINAMSRVMGFLLICIGVQFVINGVVDVAGGAAAG
jgi:multiple antibiotic resistance protein